MSPSPYRKMSPDNQLPQLLPRFLPPLKALTEPHRHGKDARTLIAGLAALVSRSSDNELACLQDHVMFPFEMYVEKPWGPENITIQVLQFIEDYHKRVPVIKTSFLVSSIDRIMRYLNTCMLCSIHLEHNFLLNYDEISP